MAWAKAKAAIAVGTGVLLAAAGTATVVVKAVGTPMADVVSKLERQSGKRIVWDKHLNLPVTLDLKNLSLEEALDRLSVQAGAYWSVDYAVYGSDRALRQLLEALHDGTELQNASWTNLSAAPLHATISMETHSPGTLRSGGGFVIPKGTVRSPDDVRMVIVLPPANSDKMAQSFETALRTINLAMENGAADGVLAPERLLAEIQLIPRINPGMSVPATAETAARTAKAARAHWTAIYTLHKSPLDGAGIKLVHDEIGAAYVQTNMLSPVEMIEKMQTNRFNLTPEERAAHEQAVEALKHKK